MLGDIDYLIKPYEPQIFLTKPNKEIISKISEAYDINQKLSLKEANELTFKIPYDIENNHVLDENYNINLLKERFYLKAQVGSRVEWYIIDKVTETMDDEEDYREIHAYSLIYELNDKLIRDYSVESYNARQVLNDVLQEVLWNIDYLDADFELTYRSFEFGNNTVLDCIYKTAETYNAIVVWNTENRTFSFVKPELHGLNKGLRYSYGHYLKTMSKDSVADEMVTRLKVFGKDDLSIQRLTSNGVNYLQNFSYFMFPFSRDDDGNVIEHSEYMSDSLCNALLDYEALVESKQDEFDDLNSQRNTINDSLATKNTELVDLQNELKAITEIQLNQQMNGLMFFEKFDYEGSTVSKTFIVNTDHQYAVMCKVSNNSNTTVSLDGATKTTISSSWVLLGKIENSTSTIVGISGSASGVEIFIQVANISDAEFNASLNDDVLIEKYNFDNKNMQIAAKENEITIEEANLDSVEDAITALQVILSTEENFTTEQIEELNPYVITKEFKDEKYIDDVDLLQAGKDKFEELRTPQTAIKINIVNFLSVIEEQGNWDKLVLGLGDEVIIDYEKLKTQVTAKIIEMSFNYENQEVDLTIANIKQIDDGRKKLEKYLYDNQNTSITVDLNKKYWDKSFADAGEFGQIFENFWDKTTNQINMAVNQTVTIDDKGITITDPNDPLRFLRATNGVNVAPFVEQSA